MDEDSRAMTRAEAVALALVAVFVGGVILPYLLDGLGLGAGLDVSASGAVLLGIIIFARTAPRSAGVRDVALFTIVVGATLALLLGFSPGSVPPGSGPDLTHHLLLTDFIERHQTLPDSSAAAAIGEMASYTPGVHFLSVMVARALRTESLLTMYPVVAVAVALKFGVFALCLLRIFGEHEFRRGLAFAGVALALSVPEYTLGSIVHDSFFAQAAAELFAVSMWWTLIFWDHRPSWWPLVGFAAAGVAAFLTWPIWVGPPLVALALLLLWRRDLGVRQRLACFAWTVSPIVMIAIAHAAGRSQGIGLVATSGAVSVPGPERLGWWLPALMVVGLFFIAGAAAARPILSFGAAIAAQSGALWLVARQAGASTPYMALKMMYLGIYPLIALAVLVLSKTPRRRTAYAAFVAGLVLLSVNKLTGVTRPAPVVSRELWEAGKWARAQVPANCVDYLVGNEYTAYWLHLAVLRNPRSDLRSTDNDTYLPQPSFARWLSHTGNARYAIARTSVLPREIREDVEIMHTVGDAIVIARPGTCPQ